MGSDRTGDIRVQKGESSAGAIGQAGSRSGIRAIDGLVASVMTCRNGKQAWQLVSVDR